MPSQAVRLHPWRPVWRARRSAAPASHMLLRAQEYLVHRRREGRQPRSLRDVPDGRGRHPPTGVPGDSAAHHGATAAATARAECELRVVLAQSALSVSACPSVRTMGSLPAHLSRPRNQISGGCCALRNPCKKQLISGRPSYARPRRLGQPLARGRGVSDIVFGGADGNCWSTPDERVSLVCG